MNEPGYQMMTHDKVADDGGSNMSGTVPIYECPPDCGLCCTHLIVEATALDVLREPRIQKKYPLKKTVSLPFYDKTWVLGCGKPCKFLDAEKRCGIYATRPNTCVGFEVNSSKCRELRAAHGMPPLEAVDREATVLNRITSELQALPDDVWEED